MLGTHNEAQLFIEPSQFENDETFKIFRPTDGSSTMSTTQN